MSAEVFVKGTQRSRASLAQFLSILLILISITSFAEAAVPRRPPPRPRFEILQPKNRASLPGPTDVAIQVRLTTSRGLNRRWLAFYANNRRIGIQLATNPVFLWRNAPVGAYRVKALFLSSPRARSGTSTPYIVLSIYQAPPPPPPPGNPTPPDNPNHPPVGPIAGHPRMWFTAADLPKLRGWANAQNPIFPVVQHLTDQMAADVEQGKVPGVCVDANNDGTPDKEYDQGLNVFWGPPTEMYSYMFAFMANIETDPALQAKYQQYAHDLVMTVVNQAKLGVYREKEECLDLGLQPTSCACRMKRRYRDMLSNGSSYVSHYLLGDKGFVFDGIPLAVDWVYQTFSAEEKQSIRQAFLIWIKDFLDADSFYAPRPIGMVNNNSLLHLDDAYLWPLRFGANNHYLSYFRGIGLMSLALDTADDIGPKDSLGNGVHDYLSNAIGSWLLITDFERRYDSPGGLSPEGSMYSDLGFKFEMQFRLALATSGLADANVWGEQVDFYNHPFWDHILPAQLHSIPPAPVTLESWQGPVYLPAWYGDGQQAYQVDITGALASVGIYDQLSGNTQRAQDIRWFLKNIPPGGSSQFLTRLGSALSNTKIRDAILTFLFFDPTLPEPSDPRGGIGNDFFDPGLGRMLSRTGWTANDRFFSYKLSWNRIDHNHDDGNMFEFWRKGQWLTKKWVAYGRHSTQSDFNNTLAIKNYCGQNGSYAQGGYSYGEWLSGSQYSLGSATQAAALAHSAQNWNHTPMDPHILAKSFTPGGKFLSVTGDATVLYNHWDQYNDTANCLDVQHASRSIVWLKPDHIVVYDRAKTGKNGFKRFWLNLPTQPSITQVSGGTQAVMTLANNSQKLGVTTVLPVPGQVNVSSTNARPISDWGSDETATGENLSYRLVEETVGDPQSARFLNVLQGADGGTVLDPVSLIQSSSGTPYQGAAVHGVAVLFAVDLNTPFSSLGYTAPAGTQAHVITGLSPNTGYQVNVNGNTVSITPGGATLSDEGGTLVVGSLPTS